MCIVYWRDYSWMDPCDDYPQFQLTTTFMEILIRKLKTVLVFSEDWKQKVPFNTPNGTGIFHSLANPSSHSSSHSPFPSFLFPLPSLLFLLFLSFFCFSCVSPLSFVLLLLAVMMGLCKQTKQGLFTINWGSYGVWETIRKLFTTLSQLCFSNQVSDSRWLYCFLDMV